MPLMGMQTHYGAVNRALILFLALILALGGPLTLVLLRLWLKSSSRIEETVAQVSREEDFFCCPPHTHTSLPSPQAASATCRSVWATLQSLLHPLAQILSAGPHLVSLVMATWAVMWWLTVWTLLATLHLLWADTSPSRSLAIAQMDWALTITLATTITSLSVRSRSAL